MCSFEVKTLVLLAECSSDGDDEVGGVRNDHFVPVDVAVIVFFFFKPGFFVVVFGVIHCEEPVDVLGEFTEFSFK